MSTEIKHVSVITQTQVAQAVNAIHLRFGEHALARVDRLPVLEAWPTGVGVVDRLTGIGGLPRGRVAVIQGRSTCGKSSLALALLAHASREFAQAVVIDPGGGFDPWALLEFTPRLKALTVIRSPGPTATGEAAVALAKAGAGFLLLSLPARVAAAAEPWLALLASAAERSSAIVIAVVETAPLPLAHTSSFSLELERTGWKFEHGQIVGLRARVACVKNKVAMPGGHGDLEVLYPLGAGLFPDRALQEIRQEIGESQAGEGRGGGEWLRHVSAVV